MSDYPRTFTIDDPKLKELLQKKNVLILEGREVSMDIEEIEQGQLVIDKQIQELESKVDLSEFEEESEQCTKDLKQIMKRADDIQAKIYAKLNKEVDPALKAKYEANNTLKEELENQRNKIALKVQKTKDRIIPMTQKAAKSLLKDEFEDFSEVRYENGEVVIDIFSHLETWKEKRRKKLNDKYLPNSKK